MKEYQNYIFDLYGTLIDISTNERKPSLWKLMAEFYNVYGCKWNGKALSDAFWLMDAEEREILRERNGVECPEIKLERVFARLLFEVPGWNEIQSDERSLDTVRSIDEVQLFDEVENSYVRRKKHDAWYKCSVKISGVPVDDLRKEYISDKEKVLDIVTSSDWCVAAANLFRVHSRKYIRPYANTVMTLRKLKEQGKGVYLLSNAQRIFTMPEIEMTGLNLLFDRMYISSDYGIMKPEKAFMELLVKEEKLDPNESVMVGNEFKCDIAVALRYGMDSIYLNTAAYTKNEIDKEWRIWMKKENKSMSDAPYIVMSGDIAEILNFN